MLNRSTVYQRRNHRSFMEYMKRIMNDWQWRLEHAQSEARKAICQKNLDECQELINQHLEKVKDVDLSKPSGKDFADMSMYGLS